MGSVLYSREGLEEQGFLSTQRPRGRTRRVGRREGEGEEGGIEQGREGRAK